MGLTITENVHLKLKPIQSNQHKKFNETLI